jgi:phage FluMu protein Com
MVESKRLNQLPKCTFCNIRVNPYVIKEKEDGWIEVECPNCENTWEVKNAHGQLLMRNYQ